MKGFKEYVLKEEEEDFSFPRRKNKEELNPRDPDEELYNYFKDLFTRNPRYLRKDGGMDDAVAHWQTDQYGPSRRLDYRKIADRAWQDARDEYTQALGRRQEEEPSDDYSAPEPVASSPPRKRRGKEERDAERRAWEIGLMQKRAQWDKPYLGDQDKEIDAAINQADMQARDQYSRDMSWPTSYQVSQVEPEGGGKEPDFTDQLDARRRRRGFEITPEQVERIKDLVSKGWKERAIAVELNIPLNVVKQHMGQKTFESWVSARS